MYKTIPVLLLFLLCSILQSCAHMSLEDLHTQGDIRGKSFTITTPLKTQLGRRSYLLHVPESWDGKRELPVVVALHGAFMTDRELERYSGLSALSDEKGFLVIYPNGIGILGWLQHWNAGFCCGKAQKDGIDDAAFIDYCLDETQQVFPVDNDRVYILGVSNGGMLAYHYATHRPERIAAIAVVIGGLPEDETLYTPPRNPLPLCIFHGRDDTGIPYEGGAFKGNEDEKEVPRFASTPSLAAAWAARNGCDPTPLRMHIHGGRVLYEHWSTCRNNADVALYTIDQFGHQIPGEATTRDIPKERGRYLNAAMLAWEFFSRLK